MSINRILVIAWTALNVAWWVLATVVMVAGTSASVDIYAALLIGSVVPGVALMVAVDRRMCEKFDLEAMDREERQAVYKALYDIQHVSVWVAPKGTHTPGGWRLPADMVTWPDTTLHIELEDRMDRMGRGYTVENYPEAPAKPIYCTAAQDATVNEAARAWLAGKVVA